jgi:hypothetical protein
MELLNMGPADYAGGGGVTENQTIKGIERLVGRI